MSSSCSFPPALICNRPHVFTTHKKDFYSLPGTMTGVDRSSTKFLREHPMFSRQFGPLEYLLGSSVLLDGRVDRDEYWKLPERLEGLAFVVRHPRSSRNPSSCWAIASPGQKTIWREG